MYIFLKKLRVYFQKKIWERLLVIFWVLSALGASQSFSLKLAFWTGVGWFVFQNKSSFHFNHFRPYWRKNRFYLKLLFLYESKRMGWSTIIFIFFSYFLYFLGVLCTFFLLAIMLNGNFDLLSQFVFSWAGACFAVTMAGGILMKIQTVAIEKSILNCFQLEPTFMDQQEQFEKQEYILRCQAEQKKLQKTLKSTTHSHSKSRI